MALSRERVLEMNEVELRTTVLLPLFRAMGFKDVHHHHGGSTEKGKDIVMWFPTPIGTREYYAVIVKATPLSGQAKVSRGTAGEVLAQVSQAFGSPFTDPTTLEKRQITKCFVVTPHTAAASTVEALDAMFAQRFPLGAVQLLHGEKLWELIQKHSPERTALAQLQSIGALLANASPDYGVVAKLNNEGIVLNVEPKHAQAKDIQPPIIKARFVFPQSPEGQTVAKAFDEHIRLGTPITIPGEFIESFEPPSFLAPFVPDQPLNAISVTGPSSSRILSTTVVSRTADGIEERLVGVRLRLHRIGTEEIELQTDSSAPWTVSVTCNRATGIGRISWSFSRYGPAKPLVEAARFQSVLSKGGTVTLIDEQTGLPFWSLPVPENSAQAPHISWLRFVESAFRLQSLSGVPLTIPEDVRVSDAREVIELIKNIEGGIFEPRVQALEFSISSGSLSEVLKYFDSPEAAPLVLVAEETFEVFGVTVPLGKVVHSISKLRLSERSRSMLAEHTSADPVRVQLEPSTETVAWGAYVKWLKPDQLEEIGRRLPTIDLNTD